MLFHTVTNMVTPQPCPVDHNIYNIGRHFLCYHYYKLCLSNLRPNISRDDLFKKRHFQHNINIAAPYHKDPSPWDPKFYNF